MLEEEEEVESNFEKRIKKNKEYHAISHENIRNILSEQKEAPTPPERTQKETEPLESQISHIIRRGAELATRASELLQETEEEKQRDIEQAETLKDLTQAGLRSAAEVTKTTYEHVRKHGTKAFGMVKNVSSGTLSAMLEGAVKAGQMAVSGLAAGEKAISDSYQEYQRQKAYQQQVQNIMRLRLELGYDRPAFQYQLPSPNRNLPPINQPPGLNLMERSGTGLKNMAGWVFGAVQTMTQKMVEAGYQNIDPAVVTRAVESLVERREPITLHNVEKEIVQEPLETLAPLHPVSRMPPPPSFQGMGLPGRVSGQQQYQGEEWLQRAVLQNPIPQRASRMEDYVHIQHPLSSKEPPPVYQSQQQQAPPQRLPPQPQSMEEWNMMFDPSSRAASQTQQFAPRRNIQQPEGEEEMIQKMRENTQRHRAESQREIEQIERDYEFERQQRENAFQQRQMELTNSEIEMDRQIFERKMDQIETMKRINDYSLSLMSPKQQQDIIQAIHSTSSTSQTSTPLSLDDQEQQIEETIQVIESGAPIQESVSKMHPSARELWLRTLESATKSTPEERQKQEKQEQRQKQEGRQDIYARKKKVAQKSTPTVIRERERTTEELEEAERTGNIVYSETGHQGPPKLVIGRPRRY